LVDPGETGRIVEEPFSLAVPADEQLLATGLSDGLTVSSRLASQLT
jgi:hypothetical protein